METKKCAVCGKEKPLSEMSKSYPTRCKECVAEHTRLVRQRARNQQEKPLAPAEPHIDWEQRRYEIAKAIYPEVIKATHPRDAARVGNTTVLFADVLIKALKGGTEQEKEEPKEHKHEAVEVKIGSTIQIEGVDYVCLNAGDNDCCSCDFLIDGDCASPSWLKCLQSTEKMGKM